jgi:hypothetical protein
MTGKLQVLTMSAYNIIDTVPYSLPPGMTHEDPDYEIGILKGKIDSITQHVATSHNANHVDDTFHIYYLELAIFYCKYRQYLLGGLSSPPGIFLAYTTAPHSR